MKIYQPREKLRPYVRYYWVLESDEPFSVLTFPIGCPQIIFHRGNPLYIPELDKSQSYFTISGQVNFPAHIQSCGHLEMIVAVFYPHTHRRRHSTILKSQDTILRTGVLTILPNEYSSVPTTGGVSKSSTSSSSRR